MSYVWRRGPTPALSDAQLLTAIRTDQACSPFQMRAIVGSTRAHRDLDRPQTPCPQAPTGIDVVDGFTNG